MKLLVGLALAAAFGETAPTTLPGSSACLQATGTPAEVAASVDGGTQLFRAGANGFTADPVVPTGTCTEVRTRPSGAGVIAGAGSGGVSVRLRDPGGNWAAPVVIGAVEPFDTLAAVSDRGDVVVAWLEHPEDQPYRVLAARRPAGGTFGPPELLATTNQPDWLQAGIAGNGEAFVMIAAPVTDRPPMRVAVRVAIGAPGAAFALVPVGEARWRSRPALAVGPDGRALVTLTDGRSVLAVERPPGGAFGAPVAVGPAGGDLVGVVTSAALDATGAAVVAWRGVLQGGVRMTTRRGGGTFTPVVTAVRPSRLDPDVDPFYFTEAVTFYQGFFPDRLADTLTLTADGRALFSWVRRRGFDARSASLATLPLGGSRAEVHTRGGAITQVAATAPLVLADGTAALAYNARLESLPRSSLHLAFGGARGGVRTPVPPVKVNQPHPRTIGPSTGVSVSLVCARACDARAVVVGEGNAQADYGRAGSKFYLSLVPGYLNWSSDRTVRIRVTYGAAGSERVRSKLVTVTRRTEVKPPRITGLTARRVGDSIRVRWGATRRPSDTTFFIAGTASRNATGEPLAFTVQGGLQARPTVTIASAGVQWVTVRMRSLVGYTRETVRVTG